MASMCLDVGGVKITAEIPCDEIACGEMLVVNGQCFVVNVRYCTVEHSGTRMHMRLHAVEWDGTPAKIDRKFWEMLRKNAHPDVWHWSGTFPEDLQRIVTDEQEQSR